MKNLFLTILISFSIINLYAQNDSLNNDLGLLSIEDLLSTEVISASKGTNQVKTAPAVIHVVKEEEIENQGWTSLSEVLENLPGIEI